ncbi:TRAP transporter substrate-binding protein [Sinirhodobacter populi]|uniref:TRAP transporter substrate-binding protein n=1 Tax=Paenirhodobacter populi TaxID=2306993 RepID=A0A443KHL2_9RHOB|nr:TRAP transporter substrate-binding protein [Sinirhodobacter populi]RWR32247.1 TRAP transporter substrate-binding protein [Sinirhodobacter populi]
MFRRTFLTTAAAGVGLGFTALRAQTATLRIGLITPPAHQWSKSAEALSARLAAKSNGELTLNVLAAGQLGSESQMLQQLQTGALDFAFLTIGEFANRDADFGALLAPYLVRGIPEARRLLAQPTATELLGKTRRMGMEGLGFGLAGMRQILLRRPAVTGADLAGRKIRSLPLPQELDFWTKCGATPTPLPLPALYDAMSNGQIDGMQIDYEGAWNSRYFDLGQEMLASDHMLFPMVAVASARRWQSFAPEMRMLIAAEITAEIENILTAYETLDPAYRGQIEATGFPVHAVGPEFFGDAVNAWYDEWRVRTPLLTSLEAEAGRR